MRTENNLDVLEISEDKNREMFLLLKEVEKFLSQKWDWNTGPWDEQTAKEHLKKKIAALNENTSRT